MSLGVNIDLIATDFKFDGKVLSVKPFGNGHINVTFLVLTNCDNKINKYIIQRIFGFTKR